MVKRTKSVTTRLLRDLGERRILHELIVPRFPPTDGHIVDIGDDCAVLPSPPPGQEIVVTTDPCPTPVVCILEGEDLYHFGRLTILINVSDLAAMGAIPIGILVSTVMPEDMPVDKYERFLDGLAEASQEWGCPVIGGNIKDGFEFTAMGTALGSASADHIMRRIGARIGDHVCVIGEMGLFWGAVMLRLLPNLKLNTSDRALLDAALYHPVARLKEGIALAKSGVVTSCMDSSDGISGALSELALVNSCDIVIDKNMLQPAPALARAAQIAAIDPRKLMLSWGNWELVCTVRADDVQTIRAIIASMGCPFRDVGTVAKGTGKVWIDENGKRGQMTNFASERFSSTSFFTHGLKSYYEFLRDSPIAVWQG